MTGGVLFINLDRKAKTKVKTSNSDIKLRRLLADASNNNRPGPMNERNEMVFRDIV